AATVDWSTPTLVAAGGLGVIVLAASRPPADATWRRFGLGGILGMLSCLTLLVVASSFTAVYADYAISMLPLLVVGAGSLVAAGVQRVRGRAPVFAAIA